MVFFSFFFFHLLEVVDHVFDQATCVCLPHFSFASLLFTKLLQQQLPKSCVSANLGKEPGTDSSPESIMIERLVNWGSISSGAAGSFWRLYKLHSKRL